MNKGDKSYHGRSAYHEHTLIEDEIYDAFHVQEMENEMMLHSARDNYYRNQAHALNMSNSTHRKNVSVGDRSILYYKHGAFAN